MASCFYFFAVFSAADSLGRHTFKMIATSAAGTIPDPPKIKRTGSGRYVRAAALEPRPYPRPRATDTMVMLLVLTSSLVINWKHHDSRSAENALRHDGDDGCQLRE